MAQSIYDFLISFVFPPPWADKSTMWRNTQLSVPISAFLAITDLNVSFQIGKTVNQEKDSTGAIILKRMTQLAFLLASSHHTHNTLRLLDFDNITENNILFYFNKKDTRDSKLSLFFHLSLIAPIIYAFYLFNKYEKDNKIKNENKRWIMRLLFGASLAMASIPAFHETASKPWLLALFCVHSMFQCTFIPLQWRNWLHE